MLYSRRVAAKRWQKKQVIEQVWQQELKINDSNFHSILIASKKAKHDALYNAAITYVARNLKRLKSSKLFQNLQKEPEILISILSKQRVLGAIMFIIFSWILLRWEMSMEMLRLTSALSLLLPRLFILRTTYTIPRQQHGNTVLLNRSASLDYKISHTFFIISASIITYHHRQINMLIIAF